jgi:hypothetical protein
MVMPSCLEQKPLAELAGRLRVTLGYPNQGWVLLALLAIPFNQSLIIRCSNVFSPFPAILRWLNQLADCHLPAEMEIDEEGRFKHLVATVGDVPETIEFRATDDAGLLLMRCRLGRAEVVREFIRALREWLAERYHPDQFGTRSNLRDLDLQTVAARVGQVTTWLCGLGPRQVGSLGTGG